MFHSFKCPVVGVFSQVFSIICEQLLIVLWISEKAVLQLHSAFRLANKVFSLSMCFRFSIKTQAHVTTPSVNFLLPTNFLAPTPLWKYQQNSGNFPWHIIYMISCSSRLATAKLWLDLGQYPIFRNVRTSKKRLSATLCAI